MCRCCLIYKWRPCIGWFTREHCQCCIHWVYGFISLILVCSTQHNAVGLTMTCEKKVCNYYQLFPLFLLICIHFIYIYCQSENMLSLHFLFVTSVWATFERLFMFTLEISAYMLVTSASASEISGCSVLTNVINQLEPMGITEIKKNLFSRGDL